MTEDNLDTHTARLVEMHHKALGYENLSNACGYVGNGTSETIKIEMTEDLSKVRVSGENRSVMGATLSEALSNYEVDAQVLKATMIDEKAEAFDNLCELFAIATETGQVLKVGEDDATREFIVRVGREWSCGHGLMDALENAVNEMKPSAPKP
ncbi:hypothetical protein [Sulfitobacter sp. R18_1]|uniref:hypothetical protein n=1 Tax=Sulfitobacter sp. R18_1 TaxID=2821104 RepID=UPI001AD9E0D3|nr:hypothetical protein [Sulfitobacter sp. R18_1]MBO9427971.1 hypothetical protein [Sulfitobacter sp. R18_1]